MNKYKKQAAFIPLRQRLPTSLKFRRTGHNKTGFTIVELLVVIVVIAILAAITVVSYTGISNKASLASLQSDLTNASNTLKLYQVDNMAYPTNIADCPTPSSTTKICLKLSPGNTPTYEYNNDTSPQTYNLKLTNSTAGTGVITNNSKPIIPTPAPLSPVADWLAIPTGEHYGNFYDSVTKGWATVTRTTPKTIYDPSTNHIYDVPAGYLAVNPRSDGKSGSEAVIEEARSNYLLNSYWNSGSAPGTNWSLSGTITGTPTQTISASSLYGNAYRFIYTGAAGDSSAYEMLIQSTPAASFASGDTATASFWFKGLVNGVSPSFYLQAKSNTGLSLGSSSMQNYNPTSTWQYISVTYSNLPASTDNVQLKIYMGSTSHDLDNGDTIDISIAAAQLEKGSFATSYIPTTTTTATRNADVVTVPTSNWSASAGTIFAVANDPSSTDKRQVLNWYKDTNNEYSLQRYQGSYGTPGFQVWESPTNLSGAVTKSLAGYSTIAGTYLNNGPITAYLNGSPGTPTANMTTINGLASTASIGSHSTGVQYYNGSIQRLTVYNSALSSGDVSTVTSAIQNGP